MLAGLVSLAAALPGVIADPRWGPSPWQLVELGATPPPAAGYLVQLPPTLDQESLQQLVWLAAQGVPVVSLGLPADPAFALYLDGVVVEKEEEAQSLRACCPQVPAVVPAAHPWQALSRLSWQPQSWLVPPQALWAGELDRAFAEPQLASGPGGSLPTASRDGDLALLVALPVGFPGGPVSLPSSWVSPSARLLSSQGEEQLPVAVRGEGAQLVLPPLPQGGLLVVPRPLPPGGWEQVEVKGQRELSLAEILARHHRQVARQQRLVANFQGWQRLLLRVRVSELDRSFEVELAGPLWYDPQVGKDWQVQQAWVNGVAWEPQKLPQLPLLQPQAAKVPPLALELSPSYRYELVGKVVRDGREYFAVSFRQEEGGQRRWGRALLDGQTFGLAELETYLVAGQGAVRSARTVTLNQLRSLGQTPLWLPQEVEADEVVAAFGALATVHRRLRLENLQLNVAQLPARRGEAWAGDEPMFRERGEEVLVLEPDGQGGRREVRGEERDQRFLLAGLAADPSFSFPLPLAGYQLLQFRFRGRQEQLRAFLAGAFNDLAWSRPGRWELSAQAFLQLAPITSSLWQKGREEKGQELRLFRQRLGVGAALQEGFLRFSGKLELSQLNFARTQHTDPAFRLPKGGQELGVQAGVAWARGQSLAEAQAEFGQRLAWASWGYGEEPKKRFWRAWARFRWERDLWPLVKLGLGGELASSSSADRFSRWSLGSVTGGLAGVPAGRVTAEAYGALRLSLAMPLGWQQRLEVGWDTAWIRQRQEGLRARPISGLSLGLAAQGPWKTLLQLQVGLPLVLIGPNQPSGRLLLLRPL